MTVKVTLGPMKMNPAWEDEASRLGAERVANRARALCPVHTGALRNSIRSRTVRVAGHVRGQVEATAEHAIFVHEGTGLWGPRHDYIRPKRARMLHWVDYSGNDVFAMKVRGVPPRPFLVWALRDEMEGVARLEYVHPYTRTRITSTGPKTSAVRGHVRRRKK